MHVLLKGKFSGGREVGGPEDPVSTDVDPHYGNHRRSGLTKVEHTFLGSDPPTFTGPSSTLPTPRRLPLGRSWSENLVFYVRIQIKRGITTSDRR